MFNSAIKEKIRSSAKQIRKPANPYKIIFSFLLSLFFPLIIYIKAPKIKNDIVIKIKRLAKVYLMETAADDDDKIENDRVKNKKHKLKIQSAKQTNEYIDLLTKGYERFSSFG